VEFSWDEDPGSRDDRSEMQKLEHRLTDLLKTGDVQAPPPAPWRHHPQASVVLLSANEPADVRRYVKFGRFRLRRFESCIDVSLASPDKEPDAVVDSWRENIEDRVRDRWRLIEAYLQWQLRRWSQKHPDLPQPKQVILWVRLYRVPPPEDAPSPWTWQGPEWHPVARWQPDAEWQPGLLPVEMFNPVVDRFETVRERHESQPE